MGNSRSRSGLSFVPHFILIPLMPFASGGEVDVDRLRKLAELPQIEISAGFSFGDETKIVNPLRREEVAQLLDQLHRPHYEATGGDAADAERWNRLAVLYRLLEEEGPKKEAAVKATALYRKLLEKSPQDPKLLAGLGSALDLLGKTEEAEAILRRACAASPKDWRALAALAHLHHDLLRRALFQGTEEESKIGTDAPFADDWFDRIRLRNDAPERIARVRKVLGEADDLYDRAVATAPVGEPGPLEERSFYRSTIRGQFQVYIRLLEGSVEGSDDCSSILAENLRNAAHDLDEAARLRPDDYPATARFVCLVFQSRALGNQPPSGPNCLPEEWKEALQQAMIRLEDQAKILKPSIAASSLNLASGLRMLSMDQNGAEKDARAAIAADPSREPPWSILLALFIGGDRIEDAISLTKDKLKTLDTARDHFILAKLFEKLPPEAMIEARRLDEMEKELNAALQLEPEEFFANLSLVVLAIRRGKEKEAIVKLVERAREVYDRVPSHETWVEYSKVGAIAYGVTGNQERALGIIRKVIEVDTKNPERPREILAALGGEAEAPSKTDAAIPDQEAKRYFTAHPEEFVHPEELNFRMITVDEGPQAAAILDRIDAELDAKTFAEVARGIDPEKETSIHTFIWFKATKELKDWKEAIRSEILSLKPGQIRRRLKLADGSGWRYLEMISRTPERAMTFEEARPEVLKRLRASPAKGDPAKESSPAKK